MGPVRWAGLGCLFCGSAFAESIPGIPEPPTAWSIPLGWAGLGNDLYGSGGHNTDDFRTATIEAGVCYEGAVIAVDYSILTNRGITNGLPESRSDQLTATAGYVLGDDLAIPGREQTTVRLRAIVGVGLRVDRRLGGSDVQNSIHNLQDIKPVTIGYDHERRDSPLCFVNASMLLVEDPQEELFQLRHAQIGIRADAAVVVTTAGERQELLGARLVILGKTAQGWIGLQRAWHQGQAGSPTAGIVARHEEGNWLTFGTDARICDHFTFFTDGGLNLVRDEATATIGGIFGMPSGRGDGRPSAVVHEEIGVCDGGYLLRARVPFGATPALLPWSAFFDYRFGTVTGVDWEGNYLNFDQWSMGVQVDRDVGPGCLVCDPFVELGVAYRRETVIVKATQHRFAQQAAMSLAAVGGVGLRLGCMAMEAVSFSLSYDVSLPITSGIAEQGADRERYLVLRRGFAYRFNLEQRF